MMGKFEVKFHKLHLKKIVINVVSNKAAFGYSRFFFIVLLPLL